MGPEGARLKATKIALKMTSEQIQNRTKAAMRGYRIFLDRMTDEERSRWLLAQRSRMSVAIAAAAAQPAAARSERAKIGAETRRKNGYRPNEPFEVVSERTKRSAAARLANQTPEQLRAIAIKGWETRRAKFDSSEQRLDDWSVKFIRHWLARGYSVDSVAAAFSVSSTEIEKAVA
jgi:hypothetical protein